MSSKCEMGLKFMYGNLCSLQNVICYLCFFPQIDLLDKVMDFLMSPKSSGRVSVAFCKGIKNAINTHDNKILFCVRSVIYRLVVKRSQYSNGPLGKSLNQESRTDKLEIPYYINPH